MRQAADQCAAARSKQAVWMKGFVVFNKQCMRILTDRIRFMLDDLTLIRQMNCYVEHDTKRGIPISSEK